MRSAVFLLMLVVCFVALPGAAADDNVDKGQSTDNLEAAASTLTTTKAPTAPAAPAPVPVPPLPVASEPEAIITTSTAASSSSATPPQQAPPEQGQPQRQTLEHNQGGQENERGLNAAENDKTDVVITTTTKAANSPRVEENPTDHTDLSPQRKQDPAPLQPATPTSEGAPGHQNSIPSKDTDAGKQEDKGNKQAKTSTNAANDIATPAVPTNGDKEINVAQTSVTSTSVPTNGQSSSPTTILPKLSNAMQQVDKKDSTSGRSSLCALAALATLVIMAV